MINEIEQIFICSLAIYTSILVRYKFKSSLYAKQKKRHRCTNLALIFMLGWVSCWLVGALHISWMWVFCYFIANIFYSGFSFIFSVVQTKVFYVIQSINLFFHNNCSVLCTWLKSFPYHIVFFLLSYVSFDIY